ncbi:hypothetical protein MSIMFB_04696 [Mycobacterium simulans]|uniref:Uncharacterized protein n=1 Tax=Mycobacterium simulans TaxID=627089 RepID=A0A7Z7IP56_9MYCO|nr:hypothetical protein MSIMFB_04696 [Mycobacterium simulans]
MHKTWGNIWEVAELAAPEFAVTVTLAPYSLEKTVRTSSPLRAVEQDDLGLCEVGGAASRRRLEICGYSV